MSGCIGHQSSHTGQLFDLLIGTTGSGVSHHEDVIVFIQSVEQCFCQRIVGLLPGIYNLFVTLFVCNQTTFEVSCNLVYRCLCFGEHFRLLRRHGHIGNGYGHGCTGGVFISGCLDIVQNLCGFGSSVCIDNFFQNLFQLFLGNEEINLKRKLVTRNRTVYVSQILRQNLIEEESSECGAYVLLHYSTIFHLFFAADGNLGLQGNVSVLVCQDGFVHIAEEASFALLARTLLCQIVDTKNHILGRNGYRTTIGRFQQVVRRKKHETALCLRFYRQRQMDSHLVTVEVGVECGTNQRVQLNRFTFYQNRLERLDTQTMQRRGTVQHNRMLFDDVLENVPYLRLEFLDHFLCIFDVMCSAVGNQLFHNERFKQLDCHFFRQTALVNLQFRSYDDNRTAGVVNTFTKKVLTETAGFTFQHVGQRFQRTVSRTGYRTAAAAVVDQGINCLLEHTFLVAHDDIRRTELQQSLQTVVTVDDTAVQVIQVGCCKTSSVKLYHRTQIRRNNRNRIKNHPLRTVSGLTECLNNLKSLDDAGSLLSGRIFKTCL